MAPERVNYPTPHFVRGRVINYLSESDTVEENQLRKPGSPVVPILSMLSTANICGCWEINGVLEIEGEQCSKANQICTSSL